ncbi:MAG: hypothetical protein EZS28_038745 [Streblomastix strix]|uniref:Uncharacterized protein n=1 Tax=Streblomastix strix TaxID=222440 RepID=A0A5J4U5S1_9EUKA|nr:MAG: hypothetical protein EZS28_038745 [Streblomastix strix]
MILSHDTVLMFLRLSEDQQKSKQEKINALNERDLIVEERNGLQRDNEIALTERDGERQEKERAQVELNRAQVELNRTQNELNRERSEKDQQKRRADSAQVELNRANAQKEREKLEKERAQFELNRERTEKDQQKRRADSAQVELNRAKTQIDQEKQRTNNAEELTRIFQSQVETTQSEVTRLTSEVRRLNQVLQIRETVPSTPKAQLKQTPVPTPKPKQAILQVTSSAQAITVNLRVPSGISGHKDANRFNHDNTLANCTISTDPIISEGIVYYESVFENHDNQGFAVGIADSSVVFKPNYGPEANEN